MGTRALTTVFGTVELIRMGYSRPGVPGIFPLDRALTLPARSFSYELQRRLVKAAVQNPFLDSVQTIADLTLAAFGLLLALNLVEGKLQGVAGSQPGLE
jgi:hypothetical protein